METAARKIARLDRSIARTGETVTLQRTAVDAAGAVTVAQSLTLPAWVRANYPQDTDDGSVRENRVVISSTQILVAAGSPPEAFGLPVKDDRILIQDDTSIIENVAPIYYGGALVRIELICRG